MRRPLLAILALALPLLAGCSAMRWLAGAPASGGAPMAAHETSARPAQGGAALLERRCASCHALPDPQKMSGPEWIASLERMKQVMRMPESEWDSLAALARRQRTRP